MENNEEQIPVGEQQAQQPNPFQIIMMKIEMLESYVTQINTYMAELSKVNNNGWETYEDWSKRIGQEMKFVKKEDKAFDFSVKRKSGIIV
ncbi:MAG: hypothetical protein RLZZ546_2632 [Bacteroidota bacterium]|jgi:hypothetical protein